MKLAQIKAASEFTVGAGANAADAESDEAAELRRQAEQGLSNRLKVNGLSQGASEEDYRARLAFELDAASNAAREITALGAEVMGHAR